MGGPLKKKLFFSKKKSSNGQEESKGPSIQIKFSNNFIIGNVGCCRASWISNRGMLLVLVFNLIIDLQRTVTNFDLKLLRSEITYIFLILWIMRWTTRVISDLLFSGCSGYQCCRGIFMHNYKYAYFLLEKAAKKLFF